MKTIIAAVLAGVAAAENGLSPSWSFASTTTITDKVTTWYTVSTPFLTTITTDVSGTTETITETKVSISIGTIPPSTTGTATSTINPIDPCANTVSGAVVLECGDVAALSPPTSTEELITYTHSNPQSNTINDSDILPTASSTTSGYGGPADSTSTTIAAGTTVESSLASASTPLGYGGGDGISSTSVDSVATVTVTVIVGGPALSTPAERKTVTSTTGDFTYTLSSTVDGLYTLSSQDSTTTLSTPPLPPAINSTGIATTSSPSSNISLSPTTSLTTSTSYGTPNLSTPASSSTSNATSDTTTTSSALVTLSTPDVSTSTSEGAVTSSSAILTLSTPTTDIPTTLVTADPPTSTEEIETFTTVELITRTISLPPDTMTGTSPGGDALSYSPTDRFSTSLKVKRHT